MKERAVFVTGTDLGVGKTTSAVALLQSVRSHGGLACGYKPVFSYPHKAWRDQSSDEDALLLQEASSPRFMEMGLPSMPVDLPLSTRRDQHRGLVDFSLFSETLYTLRQQANLVVIEGLGGWRLPLNRQQSVCQWVKEEGLPVILVVAIKLGCINHALLTAESIERRGLRLLGWIANCINPFLPYYEETLFQLKEGLSGVQIGEIPYLLHQRHHGLSQHIDQRWVESIM